MEKKTQCISIPVEEYKELTKRSVLLDVILSANPFNTAEIVATVKTNLTTADQGGGEE